MEFFIINFILLQSQWILIQVKIVKPKGCLQQASVHKLMQYQKHTLMTKLSLTTGTRKSKRKVTGAAVYIFEIFSRILKCLFY